VGLGHPGLERLAHFVGALADLAALVGRQLADPAQQVGQLGLATQQAHAELLELVGAAGGLHGRQPLGVDLFDAVEHQASVTLDNS
jgi:hypothetical protein